MVRIALISPPGMYRDVPDPNALPLGLVMLATGVRDIADVAIIDAWSQCLSVEKTLAKVREFDPDLVGISLPFSECESTGIEIAEKIKSERDIPVIFGGINATFRSDFLMSHSFIDAVALGEFDFGFRKLIEVFKDREWAGVIKEKIPNLLTDRTAKTPIQQTFQYIDNLDSFPIPDFSLLPGFPDRYSPRLLVSRGCAFNCPYCASVAFWGRRVRAHSPERVIREMSILKEKWGVTRVSFSDDTFNIDPRRSRKIAELIIESGLGMEWGANMRPELITEDDLRLYVRSGLRGLLLGLESGSARILEKINRKHDLEKTREMIRLAESLGVHVHASFMIGLPDETEEDIRMTLDYARELPSSSLGFHIFHPLRGSEYGEHPEKYGIEMVSDGVGEIDAVAPVRTKNLSPMRILDYYHIARGIAEERMKGKG